MKKIIIICLCILFFKINVFATDSCVKIVLQNANFTGKVIKISNLRDNPCTYNSNVLGASKIGDIYQIISKVDGWYKIKVNNTKTYWIRDQAIQKISDNNIVEYKITTNDQIIINKLVSTIDKIIQKKGLIYKKLLLTKLTKLINNGKTSLQIKSILKEVKNQINNIEIISNNNQDQDKEVNEKDDNENIDNKDEINDNNDEINDNNDTSENITNKNNIDFTKINDSWLSLYNNVRNDLGLKNYEYNSNLNKTALEWSNYSKNKGEITHKRNSGDSYYDYNKINSRFADRGIVCKNINRITHTENIGYGEYSCSDGECTNELSKAIKSTFLFYMSEKDKSYKPHYNSIVNPYFTQIGLGVSVQKVNSSYYKYYLTVHYCTELIK